MLYLISEILVSLAIAALLGVAIGWWLRASRASVGGGAVQRDRAAELRAASAKSSELEAQLAAEREAHRVAVSNLEELQSVHADCDFAFSTLRDQIVALRRRVAEAESGAASKPRGAGAANENGATATLSPGGRPSTRPRAARPTWLLESPSRLPDDLKRINGVGLRLEKRLNDLGVYYFQQVAEMTGSDAAWIDDQLGDFRGKLYRDDWITQARALVEGRAHLKEY